MIIFKSKDYLILRCLFLNTCPSVQAVLQVFISKNIFCFKLNKLFLGTKSLRRNGLLGQSLKMNNLIVFLLRQIKK